MRALWIDANLDGVYAGTAQIQVGAPSPPTNIRIVFEGKMVPEPSMLLLGRCGILGLAIAAWRRRKV